MIVAIDGPSGVGKSTVSRAVADRLGSIYLDTGATYRAATLAVLQAGSDIACEDDILAELEKHSIDYTEAGVTLDGEPVALDVRSDAVTCSVSEVSAHPRVRALLVDVQRSWVDERSCSAVVEGRDIGTVVFPDAPVKVYLTASPLVRAERRARDVEAKGRSIEEIAAAIEVRDHADSTRETSPLRPANDATVIDTSDLTIDKVVDRIVAVVEDARSRE